MQNPEIQKTQTTANLKRHFDPKITATSWFIEHTQNLLDLANQYKNLEAEAQEKSKSQWGWNRVVDKVTTLIKSSDPDPIQKKREEISLQRQQIIQKLPHATKLSLVQEFNLLKRTTKDKELIKHVDTAINALQVLENAVQQFPDNEQDQPRFAFYFKTFVAEAKYILLENNKSFIQDAQENISDENTKKLNEAITAAENSLKNFPTNGYKPGKEEEKDKEVSQPVENNTHLNLTEVRCIGNGDCAYNAFAVSFIAAFLKNPRPKHFYQTENFKNFLEKLFNLLKLKAEHLPDKNLKNFSKELIKLLPQSVAGNLPENDFRLISYNAIKTDPQGVFNKYLEAFPNWHDRQKQLAETFREIAVDLTIANPKINEVITAAFQSAFYDYCVQKLNIKNENRVEDDIFSPIFETEFENLYQELYDAWQAAKKKKNIKTLNDLDEAFKISDLSLALPKYWNTVGIKKYEEKMREGGTFAGPEHITALGQFFSASLFVNTVSSATHLPELQPLYEISGALAFYLRFFPQDERSQAHYNTEIETTLAAQIKKEMLEQKDVPGVWPTKTKKTPEAKQEKIAARNAAIFAFKWEEKLTKKLTHSAVQKSQNVKQRPKSKKISDQPPASLRLKNQLFIEYHPFTSNRERLLFNFIIIANNKPLLAALTQDLAKLNETAKQADKLTELEINELQEHLNEVFQKICKVRAELESALIQIRPLVKLEKISNGKFSITKDYLGIVEDFINDDVEKSDKSITNFLKTRNITHSNNGLVRKHIENYLTENDYENYDNNSLYALSDDEIAFGIEKLLVEQKLIQERLEMDYLRKGPTFNPRLAADNLDYLERHGNTFIDQKLAKDTFATLKKTAAPAMELSEACDLMHQYWDKTTPNGIRGIIYERRDYVNEAINDCDRALRKRDAALRSLIPDVETASEHLDTAKKHLDSIKTRAALLKEAPRTKQYLQARKVIEQKAKEYKSAVKVLNTETDPNVKSELEQIIADLKDADVVLNFLEGTNSGETVLNNDIREFEQLIESLETQISAFENASVSTSKPEVKEPNENSSTATNLEALSNGSSSHYSTAKIVTINDSVNDPTIYQPIKLVPPQVYGEIPKVIKDIVDEAAPAKRKTVIYQVLSLNKLGRTVYRAPQLDTDKQQLVYGLAMVASTDQKLDLIRNEINELSVIFSDPNNIPVEPDSLYAKRIEKLTADLQHLSLNINFIHNTAQQYLHSKATEFKQTYEDLKNTDYIEKFNKQVNIMKTWTGDKTVNVQKHQNTVLKQVPAPQLAVISQQAAKHLANTRTQLEKQLTELKQKIKSPAQDDSASVSDEEPDILSILEEEELENEGKKEEGSDDDLKPKRKSRKIAVEEEEIAAPKIKEKPAPLSAKDLQTAQELAKEWIAARESQLRDFSIYRNSQSWVDAKTIRNLVIGTVLIATATAVGAAFLGPTVLLFTGAGIAELVHTGVQLFRAKRRFNQTQTQKEDHLNIKAWGSFEIVQLLSAEHPLNGIHKRPELNRPKGIEILKQFQNNDLYSDPSYRQLIIDTLLLRYKGVPKKWDRYILNPNSGFKEFQEPQFRPPVLSNKEDALDLLEITITGCFENTTLSDDGKIVRVAELLDQLMQAKESDVLLREFAARSAHVLNQYGVFTNVLEAMKPDNRKKLMRLLGIKEEIKAKKAAQPAPAPQPPRPLDLETLMLEIKRLYAAGYKAKDKKQSADLLQQARKLIQKAFLICYQKGPEGAKVFATLCLDDIIKNPPASDKKLVIATELEMEFLEKIFPPNNAVLNHEQKIALNSFALNTVVNSEKAGQILGLLATSKNEKSNELINRIFSSLEVNPRAKNNDPVVILQEKVFDKLIADMFKDSPSQFTERLKNLLQKLWKQKHYNHNEMMLLISKMLFSLTSNATIDLNAKNIGSKIINTCGEFFKEVGNPWLITEVAKNHFAMITDSFEPQQKLLSACEKSKYGPLFLLYQAEDKSNAFTHAQVRKSLETIYPPKDKLLEFKGTVYLNLSPGSEKYDEKTVDYQPYGRFVPPFQYSVFNRYMEALANTKKDAYSIQARYRIITDYYECLRQPPEGPKEPEELKNYPYSKLSSEQKAAIKEHIKTWLQDLATHLDALGLAPGVDKKIAADYVTSVLKQIDELDNCKESRKSSIELLKSLPKIAAGKLLNWGLYTKTEEAWFKTHQKQWFKKHEAVKDQQNHADQLDQKILELPENNQQAGQKEQKNQQNQPKKITPEQLQTLTPDQHTQRNIALWEATLNENTLDGREKDSAEQQRIDILKTLLSMIYYGNLQYRPDKKSEFRPAAELNKSLADWVSQGGRFNILATPEQLQEIWELIAPYVSHNGAMNSDELKNKEYFYGSASTHAFKEDKKNGETITQESKLGLKNPKQLPEYAKNTALAVAANIPKTLSKAVRSNELHKYPQHPINLRMNFGSGGVGNKNDIDGKEIEATGKNGKKHGNVLIHFDPKYGMQIGFESCEPNQTSLYGHKHGARGNPSKLSFTGDLKLDDKKARNARKAQSGQDDPGKHDCTQIDLRKLNKDEFDKYIDCVQYKRDNHVKDERITLDILSKPIPHPEGIAKLEVAKDKSKEIKIEEKPEPHSDGEVDFEIRKKPKRKKEKTVPEYRKEFLQSLLSDYQDPKVEDKKPEVEEQQLQDKRKKVDDPSDKENQAVEDKQGADPLHSSASNEPDDKEIAIAEDKKNKAEEKPQKSQKEQEPEYDAALLRTNMLLAIISEHPHPQAENFDSKALSHQISKFFKAIKTAVEIKLGTKSVETEILFTKIIKQLIISIIDDSKIDQEQIAAAMEAYGEVNATSSIVIENPQSGELTTVEPRIAKKHLHILKLYRDIEREIPEKSKGLLSKNNESFSKTDSGILLNLGINKNNSISFSYRPNKEQFFQILKQEIALWETAKKEAEKNSKKDKQEEHKFESWVSDLLDGFIKINCPKEENTQLASTSIVAPHELFGQSKAQKYARALITQIVSSIIKESGSKDLIDKVINDFRNYYITKLATNEYEKKYYNDQIIDLFVDIENNLQENLSNNKIHSFTWKNIFIPKPKPGKSNAKKSYVRESFSTRALLRFLDYLIPITTNSKVDSIQLRKTLFALNAKIPEDYSEELCIKFFYDIFSKDRDNADKNIQIILRSLFSADGMLLPKDPDEEIEPLTKFALIGYCQHLSLLTKPDSAKSFLWKSAYTHFKELDNWIKSDFKNAKKVMDLYENTVDQLKDQKEFTIIFQKPASWLTFFGKTQNRNNENKPLLEADFAAAPQNQENDGKAERKKEQPLPPPVPLGIKKGL